MKRTIVFGKVVLKIKETFESNSLQALRLHNPLRRP
jgi:hypothetical protein